MDWITFTLLAALMQSVRTAGQKQLTNSLSALQTTWSRYGFGIPIALLYMLALLPTQGPIELPGTALFWTYLVAASVAQLIATGLLVKLLSLRNFAVGTTYAKTEALMAALLGAVFFGAHFNGWTWLAILLGFAGIALVSLNRTSASKRQLTDLRPLTLGLSAGLCFGITSVSIRAGSLMMSTPPMLSAAFMLTLSLLIQGVLCTVLIIWRQPGSWTRIRRHWRLGAFIGFTGVGGSIGWFTAFALQEAAIVKTLGQIEFLFTVLLTLLFFKEPIRRVEWLGMILVIASVVVLFQLGTL